MVMLRYFPVYDTVKKILDYVERNKDKLPILEECCLEYGWDYDDLCEVIPLNRKIRRAVNVLLNQKKVNLEKAGFFGVSNKPIVSLLLARLDQKLSDGLTQKSLQALDRLLAADEAEADRLFGDEM